MILENYGLNKRLQSKFSEIGEGLEIGRVIAEHKERYAVVTERGEVHAEITGNMRFSAESREDFPAVGDWVALSVLDPDFAVIHQILPRSSTVSRRAVDKFGEIQIIATNIDFAFLVQGVDDNYNINRLERYLTICNSAKIAPLIILTKTDLISDDDLSDIINAINARTGSIPVLAVSNLTGKGLKSLEEIIEKGKTYCLLGSSGAGKSTLINSLCGESIVKIGSVSESNNKGRHITTGRELYVLSGGGIIIDNPGMREVGIASQGDGADITFAGIAELADQCRYADCKHTSESGCAVIEAVTAGNLDRESYDNYIKIMKEQEFFESSVAEKRKKDKAFCKMLKNYKKDMKRQTK